MGRQAPSWRPGCCRRAVCKLDDELLLNGGIQALGEREVVIYKPRWGAFYRTPLEEYLREREVSTPVFTG